MTPEPEWCLQVHRGSTAHDAALAAAGTVFEDEAPND